MKDKIFWGVAALGVPAMILAGNLSQTNTENRTPRMCIVGQPASETLHPVKDNVEFRSGPGNNFPKVTNTASAVGSAFQYRSLDRDVVLRSLCANDQWIQGKIVEADGTPVDWETGWVRREFVTTALTPDQAAGLWWDVNRYPDLAENSSRVPSWERDLMHEGALRVLKENKNCNSIYVGYRGKQGSYTVECSGHSGFKVQFTADDVRSGKTFGPPAAYSEQLSHEFCNRAIMKAAVHPSTVNFHAFGTIEAVDPVNSTRKILTQFDAKNGFGLKLDYLSVCEVAPAGGLKLTITERG